MLPQLPPVWQTPTDGLGLCLPRDQNSPQRGLWAEVPMNTA